MHAISAVFCISFFFLWTEESRWAFLPFPCVINRPTKDEKNPIGRILFVWIKAKVDLVGGERAVSRPMPLLKSDDLHSFFNPLLKIWVFHGCHYIGIMYLILAACCRWSPKRRQFLQFLPLPAHDVIPQMKMMMMSHACCLFSPFIMPLLWMNVEFVLFSTF